MKHFEFKWRSDQGVEIYAQGWAPQAPKAVIALAHGLGEHSGRYAPIAEFFNDNNYALLALDHHGHGKTTGKKGHIGKYAYFMDEVDQLLMECQTRYPDVPVFLYGHSMGGNIVLNYLARKQPQLAGVIATGSAIQLAFEPPKFLVMLGKLTKKIMPGFTQNNQLDPKHLSRDKEVVQRYINDPLVHDKLSSEMGLGLLDWGKWLQSYSGTLSSPALVMHGKDDPITSYKGSELFTQNVSGDVTLKVWEDMLHEIHNEVGKEEVWKYTLDWMNAHLAK